MSSSCPLSPQCSWQPSWAAEVRAQSSLSAEIKSENDRSTLGTANQKTNQHSECQSEDQSAEDTDQKLEPPKHHSAQNSEEQFTTIQEQVAAGCYLIRLYRCLQVVTRLDYTGVRRLLPCLWLDYTGDSLSFHWSTQTCYSGWHNFSSSCLLPYMVKPNKQYI